MINNIMHSVDETKIMIVRFTSLCYKDNVTSRLTIIQEY